MERDRPQPAVAEGNDDLRCVPSLIALRPSWCSHVGLRVASASRFLPRLCSLDVCIGNIATVVDRVDLKRFTLDAFRDAASWPWQYGA
jgi:hypothetical protein